jgi:putative nucleotidyltransferase with HDIG domain
MTIQPPLARILDSPEKLGELCPFPGVALRALELLRDESTKASVLVETISADPAFVAELLFCANSALFNLACRVKTIRHAVVVLGSERLQAVIMTTALRSFLRRRLRSKEGVAWWRHSLATAVLSESITVAERYHFAGAYSAGLLHDIGRLVMFNAIDPAEYAEFRRMAEDSSRPIIELEQEILGASHCEIGAAVLDRWQLPEELVLPALHHHEPELWQESTPLRIVGSACLVAGLLGFGAFRGRKPAAELPEDPSLLPAPVQSLLAEQPELLASALTDRINSIIEGIRH